MNHTCLYLVDNNDDNDEYGNNDKDDILIHTFKGKRSVGFLTLCTELSKQPHR